VDGTVSGSCSMVDFDISGVETLEPSTRELVTYLVS
jgi:hypothetical protein